MDIKEAAFIEVQAGVRYWEDATVNGVEDEDGSRIPCRSGETWCPTIDLATGKVVGWPEGVTADVHYKVCDDGPIGFSMRTASASPSTRATTFRAISCATATTATAITSS